MEKQDFATVNGVVQEDKGDTNMSPENVDISKRIKTATEEWPFVSEEPVSEFDASANLFPRAFRWLFPGGFGDYYAYSEEKTKTIGEWAKRMLRYKDGCFARDKFWCFFAQNVNERH